MFPPAEGKKIVVKRDHRRRIRTKGLYVARERGESSSVGKNKEYGSIGVLVKDHVRERHMLSEASLNSVIIQALNVAVKSFFLKKNFLFIE